MLEVKITTKISKKHGTFPRQALGQVCQGLAAFKNSNSGLSQTRDGLCCGNACSVLLVL
jgi:hypothetical protein